MVTTRTQPSAADIQSTKLIWLKGVMFLSLGTFAAILLILQSPTLKTTFLVGLTVWAFCRTYYFAFYVIEKYVDPEYRFAGLIDFVRYSFGQKNR